MSFVIAQGSGFSFAVSPHFQCDRESDRAGYLERALTKKPLDEVVRKKHHVG